MGLLAKGNGDVYRPLHKIFGKGLAVESPENQPKDAKIVNLELCSKEGASGFGSPSRGL